LRLVLKNKKSKLSRGLTSIIPYASWGLSEYNAQHMSNALNSNLSYEKDEIQVYLGFFVYHNVQCWVWYSHLNIPAGPGVRSFCFVLFFIPGMVLELGEKLSYQSGPDMGSKTNFWLV
jgi:hypothetical protein